MSYFELEADEREAMRREESCGRLDSDLPLDDDKQDYCAVHGHSMTRMSLVCSEDLHESKSKCVRFDLSG
jgi:hypothetical protein